MDPACDRHDILYWKPFCLDRWQSCPTQDDVSESFPCFQIPSAEQVWLPFFPKKFTDLTTKREKEKERKKKRCSLFLPHERYFTLCSKTNISKDSLKTTCQCCKNIIAQSSTKDLFKISSRTTRISFAIPPPDFFSVKLKIRFSFSRHKHTGAAATFCWTQRARSFSFMMPFAHSDLVQKDGIFQTVKLLRGFRRPYRNDNLLLDLAL